jgi:toxin-antitoxin system PIN domain toxin
VQALCDANVLLALAYGRHAHHRRSLTWVENQGTAEIVLCRSTQLTLLWLLTNSTVMRDDVCTHLRAWEIWDMLAEDVRFVFFEEPGDIESLLRRYTQATVPSPNLWPDAYLAAFCYSAGLQMVTFDRGFQRFPELRLHLLN